jgi:hypothetical protein
MGFSIIDRISSDLSVPFRVRHSKGGRFLKEDPGIAIPGLWGLDC